MDSMTLLAEHSNSHVRVRSLRTDDNRFSLLVRVHDEPDETTYLHLRPFFHDLGFFHVFIDTDGGLYATAIAKTDTEATEKLHQRLKDENGIELTTEGYHLLAEHSNGKRRSVLHADDERLSARAKAYIPEDDEQEETLIRLRVFVDGYGSIQLVVSNWGRVLAVTSGRTDADAYTRIRGELARKGIELE
jgi:hypothetical protein